MSNVPSKRRRLDGARKQSKLHHFFTAPSQNSNYVLDQLITQSSQKSGDESRKLFSQNIQSCNIRNGTISSLSSKLPRALSRSQSGKSPRGSFSESYSEKEGSENTVDKHTLVGPHTEHEKFNFSLFPKLYCETEDRTECSVNRDALTNGASRGKLSNVGMQPSNADSPELNSGDFHSLPFSEEIAVKLSVGLSSPIHRDSARNTENLPSDLASCDINTIPFSLIVDQPRPENFGLQNRNIEDFEISAIEDLDIDTVPHSPIVGKPVTNNSKGYLNQVNSKGKISEDSMSSQLNTCDITIKPFSPVVGQPALNESYDNNLSSGNLNSCHINTTSYSPQIGVTTFIKDEHPKLKQSTTNTRSDMVHTSSVTAKLYTDNSNARNSMIALKKMQKPSNSNTVISPATNQLRRAARRHTSTRYGKCLSLVTRSPVTSPFAHLKTLPRLRIYL